MLHCNITAHFFVSFFVVDVQTAPLRVEVSQGQNSIMSLGRLVGGHSVLAAQDNSILVFDAISVLFSL